MTWFAAFVFLLTTLLSFALTFLVRVLALKVGLADKPDLHRKLHRQSTALGGGVVLYLATSLMVGLLMIVSNPWQRELLESARELLALFVSGGVIVIVGLIDDRFQMPGKLKLLGQFVAAMILIVGGLTFERLKVFGLQFELGALTTIVTLIWLVGSINAVNLLDGIDGLASTIGLILVTAIGMMAALVGNVQVCPVALVFAASLLGFLRHNFPPASIFLGDAGSMLIGLVVGGLAILGSLKGPGTVLLAAPLACLTIPFFDSAAAILRRKLTGRSIYDTDRGHLHHRMMSRFGSNHKTLGWIAACCCVTASASLVSVYLQADWIALLCAAVVIAIFIVTRLFGHTEMLLVVARLNDIRHSFFRRERISALPRHGSVRLQGHRPWELFWEALTETADKLGLVRMRLLLNLPALEEGFHASWHCRSSTRGDDMWRVELPLFAMGRSVGKLLVVGRAGQLGACSELELLVTALDPLEDMLCEIANDSHLLEDAVMFRDELEAANPAMPDLGYHPVSSDGGIPGLLGDGASF